MEDIDIKALDRTGRSTTLVWTEGYDGQTHYADVLKALTPAFLILIAAAALMLAMF